MVVFLALAVMVLAACLCASVAFAFRSKAAAEAALIEQERLQQELKFERESAASRLQAKDESCARLLQAKDESCDRLMIEMNEKTSQMLKTLREQFANLASQTLKAQSGDLQKENSAQMDVMLKPLREQIDALRSATERTEVEHAKLAEAIGKDIGRISDVAKELAGVSEALSSNSSFQGRKGEEILAEKLRQAGLEENVNFFLQEGLATDRPDAQVCDAENRWLVIDSKVSLTAYFKYVEEKDESLRRAHLASHVASVKDKINQLAKKKYPKTLAGEYGDRDYLPVTAMFVAYEAPLQEALKAEPSLWKLAVDNNVVLVTPLTLSAYLRLVYLAWQHQKESKNQENIVKAARELLSRMNAFLMAFEAMGKTISQVQDKYVEAQKVLVDSPHAQTISKAAQKLIDLHVRLENRRGKKVEMAECLKESVLEVDGASQEEGAAASV